MADPSDPLKKNFYKRHTVEVAKDLLGKYLFVKHTIGSEEVVLSGMINETEAYHGFDDDACHGHKRKTPRCEVMYGPAGHAYVYFTYGMHYMLNLVTGEEDFPAAVLIRGVVPHDGVDVMLVNRYAGKSSSISKSQLKNLANGPGKLTKAFGITKDEFNGLPLDSDKIWLENRGFHVNHEDIQITPRIGVDYAENSKNWPWRFAVF